MTGTKVEAIHHHGVPSAENFVVGHVLKAEQHPDADRLKVCTVDLGEDQPATIVCGAPNVEAGMTVAVARPGAVMPDGTKLRRAKLRGVISEGMILAASELDLEPAGDRSAGIMVLEDMTLDAEFAAGTPLAAVLPISTEVLELEITPNRPDCLGVYGVARELHAATGAALALPPWAEDPGSEGQPAGASVRVECADLCPRFTARVFEDVTIAPSPPWLKARLMAAGQRPINNVVDITNYAMLLTGQPLHAFDLDRVAGGELTVRRAREGEQVADPRRADTHPRCGDGGDRGCRGPHLDRRRDGRRPLGGATGHAPRADGGGHLERPQHPPHVLVAGPAKRGLRALREGPAARAGHARPGRRRAADARDLRGAAAPRDDRHRRRRAAGPDATLRERRVEAILGLPVPVERQAEILRALDFLTAPAEDGLDVTVPALRRDDVSREIDLIEEVARIDGLERLPATLPARRGAAGRLTHAQRVRRGAEDAMIGRGLHEIVGWSFADPGLLDRLRAAGRTSAAGRRDGREPPVGGPGDDAPDAARLAARRGPPQRLAGSRRRGDLRVGRRIPRAPARPAATTPAEEHHALGALLAGGLTPRSWRGASGPRPTSSPPRRCWRRCSTASGVAWDVRARRARALAVPAPRPQRRGAGRARRLGAR